MKKLRVMTVVGTRPEIIRLSRVMAALDRTLDHVLVHTGQNYDYELNGVFFDDLEIRKPDHFLEAAGTTAAETIGQVIIAVDAVLRSKPPTRCSCSAIRTVASPAIAAKRRKIPVFHMEAGNRCFDERVPEEINRRKNTGGKNLNKTRARGNPGWGGSPGPPGKKQEARCSKC